MIQTNGFQWFGPFEHRGIILPGLLRPFGECQLSKAVCNSSVGLEPEELAAGGDGTGVGTGGTWDVGKCAAGRWASLQRISRICPTQGHRVTDPLNI